ncbi:MAG: RES family NAD+ phosphorylase [Balneolales bacterium]
MIVYRVTKERYAEDLSGKGAERFGGRWNNKGVPVVYTSEHRSLCLLEMLVRTPTDVIPKDLVLVEIFIPDDCSTYFISKDELPQSWKSFPHDRFMKQIGDELLIAKKHLVIKVPSVLVENEYNYLINPFHEQVSGASVNEVKSLDLDARFFEFRV